MSSKLEEAFMEAYKENLIPADMVMEAFDGIKAAIHNHKEEKAANKSGNDPKLADKIYKKLSPYLPSNWKKFSISVADHKEDPNKYGVLMMITDSTGKTSDWTKLKCADRPEATRAMMKYRTKTIAGWVVTVRPRICWTATEMSANRRITAMFPALGLKI